MFVLDKTGILTTKCWRIFAVGAFLILTGNGCGDRSGDATEIPVSDGSASVSDHSAATTVSAETPKTGTTDIHEKPKRARDEIWVDEQGQKWFGNVPMDAFFDEPYAVASDQTPIGNSPGTAVAANSSTDGVVPDAGSTTSSVDANVASEVPVVGPSSGGTTGAGEDSWESLISAEALDEEVKSIRNFMNENLQSVGTFNSSMLMLPPKAAALAALAEVATKHPEDVSWKDDATYVRDLAKKMNSGTLQRGAKDQKRMLELFEAVSDTLNRSRPSDLEKPPETDSFAEAAEMRLLMMRMEEAEKRMRTEAGTIGAMNAKKSMIVQEASMLAVMAKIVTFPGYGYEDDAVFKGFSSEIVQSAQSIKLAAESSDFASYEGALSKITTTCQNCHSKYKND